MAAFFAVLGLSLLSCGREVTGPENGIPGGFGRRAAFALDPRFTGPLAGTNLASDVAPFDSVRVTLRRLDASIAKDTMVFFPATADSIELTLEVQLPLNAGEAGIPLTLTMRYINLAGDTVFRGGPVTVQAVPAENDDPPVVVVVPLTYTGPGATAASVDITPASGTFVAGTTTQFTSVARDASNNIMPGTPVLFSSPDVSKVQVTSGGLVTWLPVRGTARVIGTLLTGVAADTNVLNITLPASLLYPTAGFAQSATVNTALGAPVTFKVAASDSLGVPGLEVTFAVTTGGGSVQVLKDTSDASGLVSTLWTLGSLVGTQSITASVSGIAGLTRTVFATGLAPVPTQLALLGVQPSYVAGTAFGAITVQARDAGGVLTPAFVGPVTIALDATGAAGTLAGTATVNAVAGVATFTNLSLANAAAGFRLVSTSGALTPDTSATFTVAPNVPATIVAVEGDAQAGTIGLPLGAQIGARVRDAFNNDVPGATVNFAVLTGGGSLLPLSTTTDAGGVARSSWTLGALVGAQTVRASVNGAPAIFVDFSANASAGAPVRLEFVVEPVLSQVAGTTFTPVVTVRAVDALGALVTTFAGNITLALAANPGGATLLGTITQVAVGGTASFSDLQILKAAVGYTIMAGSAGLTPDTTAAITVTNAAATTLALVDGDAQTDTVDQALPLPFRVRVTDAFGNPVPGVGVNWAVTVGTGNPVPTFNLTNASGEATSTLTLPTLAGAIEVEATVGGLSGSPQTFTVTAIAGQATQLVFGTQTATAVAGTAMTPGFTVEARDVYGNLATDFVAAVAVGALGGNPLAVMTGTTNVNAIAGVATFTDLSIDLAGTGYQLIATSGGLPNQLSSPFDITSGTAVRLVMGTQPANATAGAVATAHIVTVQDALGNIVTGFAGSVTVSLDLAPGGATLGGTIVQPATTGTATFGDNTFSVAGLYRLRYSAPGVTDTISTNFTVAPAAASTILLLAGDGQSGSAGQPLADSLVVRVIDAFGNNVAGAPITFAVTIGGGVASPLNVSTDANGLAATALTLAAAPGAWAVQASSGALTPATFTGNASSNIANAVWTGAANSSWDDPANWSGNTVPTLTDSVRIPAGTPNQPALITTGITNRFTIESGATLSLFDQGLIVFGSFDAQPGSTITAGPSGFVQVTGATGTVRGQVPRLSMLSTGTHTLNGPLDVATDLFVQQGSLDVSTFPVTVGATLSTIGTGILVMGPGSLVTVDGDAVFASGVTSAGSLTGGTLRVKGDFTQAGGDPGAFAASAGHTVELIGTATQTVTLANPDFGVAPICFNSCFGTLRSLRSAGQGGVTFLSDAKAITLMQITGDGIDATGRTLISGGTPDLSATVVTAAMVGWQTGLVRGATFNVDSLLAWGTTNAVLPAGETLPTRVAGQYRLSGSYPAGIVVDDFTSPFATFVEIDGAVQVGSGGIAFRTGGAGYVRMTDDADSLRVNGTAQFAGLTPAGQMTQGVIEITGNFAQSSAAGTTSYDAALTHRTRLLGAGPQTIDWTDPSLNRVGRLDIATTSAVTVTLGLTTLGDVNIGPTVSVVGGGAVPVTIGGSLNDALSNRWQVPNTTFAGADPSLPPAMLGNVAFLQGVTLDANLQVSGAVTVAGGVLDVNGRTLAVIGGFSTIGTGVLRMVNTADTLAVGDLASFGGASTAGQLTAGRLILLGNFDADTSPESFSASGAHETWLLGTANQQISFSNPGSGAGFQHFANLGISQDAPTVRTQLLTDVYADGQLRSEPAQSRHFFAASARAILAKGADLTGVLFDGVRLDLAEGALITSLDSLSFTTQDVTVSQLQLARTAGTFTLSNPVFSTVPTAGKYVSVTDLNGAGDGLVTLSVVNPTPTYHSGFVAQTFANTITGWLDFPGLTWTGATSNDWTVASNWNGNRVPTATDSVYFPVGVATMPVVTVQPTVRALVNDNANPVEMAGANWMTVTERVKLRSDVPGLLCNGGSLDLTHPVPAGAVTAQGRLRCNFTSSQGEISLADSLVVLDSVVTVSGTARITFGGKKLRTLGLLFMQGGGDLQMTNAADSLVVRDVSLNNSASATLSAGTVIVSGAFNHQSGAAEWEATGSHRTIFAPGTVDTANVALSAPAVPAFRHVEVRRPIRLQSAVVVGGDLLVETGGVVVGPGRATITGALYGRPGTLVAPSAVELLGVLSDTGTFSPDTAIFAGAGQQMPFTLGTPAYRNVVITGSVQAVPVATPVLINGDLVVEGTLTIDDALVPADITMRDLQVVGPSARLVSTGNSHILTVRRHALFDGASADGDLASGALHVYGDFTQLSSNDNTSFKPAPGYPVFLDSTGTISLADPFTSRFAVLRFNAPGRVRTLLTNLQVDEFIAIDANGTDFRSDNLGAGGARDVITNGLVQSASLTLRNIALVVQEGSPLSSTAQLTFAEYDPTVVQLDLLRSGGTFTLTNPSWGTIPTPPGLYLRVEDSNNADADPFTVNISGATPAFSGGFASAFNGAVINGWLGFADFTWAGTVSNAWTNPANWSGGQVPTATDSVFIPASTPINAIVPAGTTLRALIVTDNEPLTLGGLLTITGRLSTPTTAGLNCNGSLQFTGAGPKTAQGRSQNCLVRILDGTVTATDTLIVDGGTDLQVEATGVLDVGADLVKVTGFFSTLGSGRVLMQDDSSHLQLDFGASFGGASSLGDLTKGLLEVGANFTQSGTGSFLASAGHLTILHDVDTGDFGAKQVIFADTVTSGFGDLTQQDFARQLFSLVPVNGRLTLAGNASMTNGTDGAIRVAGIVSVPSGTTFNLPSLRVGDSLLVQGSFAADTIEFFGNSQPIPNTGVNFNNVIVSGGATFVSDEGAQRTINGSLTLTGGGELIVGWPDSTTVLAVNGTFRTQGTATLTMEEPNTRLVLNGDAQFFGGSASSLTNGSIEFRGNFSQGGNAQSFAATGVHESSFLGSSDQTILFTNPGAAAGSSHFADLRVGQSGSVISVQLLSDVYAVGQLRNGDGSLRRITAATPRTLTSHGANLSNYIFQNVRWQIREGAAIGSINDVTFTAMDAAQPDYVDVERNTGTLTLDGFTFASTPSGGGVYARAADANGVGDGLFVLDFTNVSPSFHNGLINLVNGATITGWPQFPSFVWTGANGNDWNDVLNWAAGVVPGPADSVTIPLGSVTNPIITTAVTLNALVNEDDTNAPLIDVSGQLTITSRLVATPAGVGVNCQGLGVPLVIAPSAGASISGRISCNLDVTGTAATVLADSTRLIGWLRVFGTGILNVSGRAMHVTDSLAVDGNGVIVMTNPNDTLEVGDYARFSGGSTDGLMTSGLLLVAKDFFQGGNPAAFSAGANHVTRFTGSAGRILTLTNPGTAAATTSHFGHLELVVGDNAPIEPNTDVVALGQLRAPSGLLQNIAAATTLELRAEGVAATDLAFTNVRLVIGAAAPLDQLDNVLFTSMSADVAQLEIIRPTGTLTLNNPTFQSTPNPGGFYVRLQDTNQIDGQQLTVTMVNPNPATHGGFIDLVSAALLGWAENPQANAISWTGGGGDGNWGNINNWDLGRVPIATDSVFINGPTPSPYTVNVNVSATVGWLMFGTNGQPTLNHTLGNTLQVDTLLVAPAGTTITLGGSSVLTGDAPMLSGGAFQWNGGTLSGAGGFLVSPGGVANIAQVGTVTLDGQVLTVGGTANIGDQSINAANSPVLASIAGGTIAFQAPNTLFNNGTTPQVVNAGTLQVGTAGNTLQLNWPVTNTGTVEVLNGTLDLRGVLTAISGTVDVKSTATLLSCGANFTGALLIEDGGRYTTGTACGGAHNFLAGSSVTGGGTYNATGGSDTEILGAFNLDSLMLANSTIRFNSTDTAFVNRGEYSTGGFLRGTGVLAFTGPYTISAVSGNVNGSGTINVRPGGAISYSVSSLRGWTLDVEGTFAWNDVSLGLEQEDLTSTFASILIRSGGTLDIQHGTTPRTLAGSVSTPITVAGTLVKSTGIATTAIAAPTTYSGVINAILGGLTFTGGCSNSGGGTFLGGVTGCTP